MPAPAQSNSFGASLLCISSLALFVVGCGDSDTSSTSTATTSSQATNAPRAGSDSTDTPEEAETVAGKGNFAGRVVLDGQAPQLELLVKSGDEKVKDAEVCGAHDVPDESMIVGAGNGVANAFVYLRKAPKSFEAAPPAQPVVIDQKGCRFFPHVSIVQVGQAVKVISDDQVAHNVHTFPKRNQGINSLMQPKDREGLELIYKTAESEPLRIACDIHAWMSAFQIVVDHPFAAITDADGRFSIQGLPAGKHEFRIWHEKAGFLERKLVVEIDPDATTEQDLTFGADKFAGSPPTIRTIVLNR